jgi:uncharacterized DUF497 family protein
MPDILTECTGFQWDHGNSGKNWQRHQVPDAECEQIHFNKPLIVADDAKLSQTVKRWYALGRTDLNRLLFAVFTIRNNLIRIIAARYE